MRRAFVLAIPMLAMTLAHGGKPKPAPPPQPLVGLSFWWQDGEVRLEDGTPKTVTLYESFKRYPHEIDITASIETETDQGIQPVIDEGDMSGLDWSGIEFVEEDWRPAFDGTFTRSRFYRGAKWMERFSAFVLIPLSQWGWPVGTPIVAFAGFDDFTLPIDDGFIRRFDARQITYGCAAIDDCSGATRFVAQGLVQLRNARNAEQRAQKIPSSARWLQLSWTEDLGNPRYVAIDHAGYDETDWSYGFDVQVDVANEPANGEYFVPGESVDIKATFVDGEGTPLHPDGSLPTYLEFVTDDIPSGLRYYDGVQELLTLYYALKHREGLTMYSLAGPTDALKFPSHEVGFFDLFDPQTDFATVAEDGFTAIATLNPSLTAQFDPANWGSPVSDTVTFVLPDDALPGTYVLTVKGRRDFGGEALNRAGVAEIQVGSATPTAFEPATGNCTSCHAGDASLGNILHGLDDRRTCYSCHASLAFEPDHALDYRIHLIHTRSERVPGNPYDCSMCHFDNPAGPARGFPGIGPF